MRRGLLAAIALVAGCLHPSSHLCKDGWACPAELACAPAPTYCGTPNEVSVCSTSTIDGHDRCMTADVPTGVCVSGACRACTSDYEACAVDPWQPMTNSGDDLKAIAVTGPRDALAVGNAGAIVHYDGTGWTSLASGASDTLVSVWIAPSGVAYVVAGTNVSTFTTSLTTVYSAASSLQAIWGASGSDIYAVGISGTIVHYNGSVWTSTTATGSPVLTSVSGTSGSDVFVVGSTTTILHWDGNQWSTQAPPSDATNVPLKAVWAASPSDVFAVGTAVANVSTILHYNGSAWSRSPIAAGTPVANLRAVWGFGGNDVFAVGTDANAVAGVILHYDGQQWSQVATPPVPMNGIAGAPPGDVLAVGASGAIWRHAP